MPWTGYCHGTTPDQAWGSVSAKRGERPVTARLAGGALWWCRPPQDSSRHASRTIITDRMDYCPRYVCLCFSVTIRMWSWSVIWFVGESPPVRQSFAAWRTGGGALASARVLSLDRDRRSRGGRSMRTIKGPGLFLAQFAGDEAPFNSWDAITRWAARRGYMGVQVPSWDARLFDLEKAAEIKDYCDEIAGVARENGVEITELSTHLQGQLVAVHPAYDEAFDGFAAPEVRGNPKARQEWAVDQVKKALTASQNLGLERDGDVLGRARLAVLYPWPQRPAGLVETAFDELARRWRPILDIAEECGVDCCYEIHPGEDLHDGVTYEMFLERCGNHARALHAVRPVALRAAVPRLPRPHRHLPRAHPDVPRQGRRVQSDRAAGRLRRLPALGRSGRPLPLARRRPGRLQGDLLEVRGLRFRRLGRGRMGVRAEASRGRRARGRRVRAGAHHPRHRASVRRLRRAAAPTRRPTGACSGSAERRRMPHDREAR